MKLMVYEHVSGGGFANEEIPASVLSEGFSMLRTVISDFKAAGHNVATTLDLRIARLKPPIKADCIVPVASPQEAQSNILKISEYADAAYIIAPETDGILRSLVKGVNLTGAASLNCSANAIEMASDKAVFYEFLKKRGVSLPETVLFNAADDLKEITETVRGFLNFPVLFKPSNGVGCCGVSIVRKEEEVATAVAKIKRESTSSQFLVQKVIAGAAASVSVFSTGHNAIPVSLNRQDVNLQTPKACSRYNGGVVPFDNLLRAKAFELAEEIVISFADFRGYVGVDFIVTEDEAVPLEINPRLTTSYVGLRSTVNFNPAEAIVNAVLERKLPKNTQSCGYTYFSKVDTANPQINSIKETYTMNEVISPPFPVSQNGIASALIAAHGSTLREATSRFREAKKRILTTIS